MEAEKDNLTSPLVQAMTRDDIRLPERPFRHIYLVQNRDYWKACPFPYDTGKDLVLTFDFAVVREVTSRGGTAEYLDHLIKSDRMERYNHETYRFFSSWYEDKDGQDIFSHRGMKISNALRLYIWTEITYPVHLIVNLLALKHIQYERILVGTADLHVMNALRLLNLTMETWKADTSTQSRGYYFPIFRWMHEQIHPSRLKRATKIIVGWLLSSATAWGTRFGMFRNGIHDIFIQPYYPTYDIIRHLNLDGRINIVLEQPTNFKDILREKYIPFHGIAARYGKLADRMIGAFHERKNAQWLAEGINISEYLYPIILERAAQVLPECLQKMDELIDFFSQRKLHLMITISNIGITNCLMINYCHKKNIPTYLIINGYLGNSYLDESKDAKWINSYGTSIKENYFSGMDNIVCLGDPRMDAYAGTTRSRGINRDNPTIVIGAAGYNNIDLNSYVAYEFDFLDDILSAFRTLIRQGRKLDIIVKVRANGYIGQYRNFVQEYYSDLPVTLYDRIPMRAILSRADCYISLYSGTLFEAACLGIPVIYYKKDTEVLAPPFDGASELVTVRTPDDLMRKIDLFYEQNHIYDAFLDKNTLEKYVGFLDGKNVERNLKFIYSLMHVAPPLSGR